MLGLKSLPVLSYITAVIIVCLSRSGVDGLYCAYNLPQSAAGPPARNLLFPGLNNTDWEFPEYDAPYGTVVNDTVLCAQGFDHCYWAESYINGKKQVLQGCWANGLINDECDNHECQLTAYKDQSLKFCCCHGDFCNTGNREKYSELELPPANPPTHPAFVGGDVAAPKTPPPGGPLYCDYLEIAVTMKEDDGDKSFVIGEYGDNLSDVEHSGTVLADNKTIRCPPEASKCFSLFIAGPNGTYHILKQGCWIQSNRECYRTVCMAESLTDRQMPQNSRFCCCTSPYCNRNITEDNSRPATAPVTDPSPSIGPQVYSSNNFENYRMKMITMAIAPVAIVAILVILIFLAFRMYTRPRKENLDAMHLMESTASPSWELDSLKLNTLINGGRYGEVWRGTLGDLDVAVKVFTGNSQKQYYQSERDIYTLPHMGVDEIPKFYGAEDRLTQGGIEGVGEPQHLLVMEFVPGGTLTNYLKNHSYDWVTMCKLCTSVARGLAHLHTEIVKGDKFKPAIAHRDLNTRNILVRPDQTCVICDFGFAMQIIGSNYIKNGNQEVAEQSSLNDVGTIRYMPPEVLEGAVNLRDCEASLKQIDIYALGLIFWEIGTRCTDLYQGLPVPEYQLPYQLELGPHPTFEEMTLKVSKEKCRPLFPDVWKDSNQGIRALKETIEDCWDQDGEARLTALCVEERMTEMEALWTARMRGVKINTTNFQSAPVPVPDKPPNLCNTNVVNENQSTGHHGMDSLRVQEENLKNLESSPTIQLPPSQLDASASTSSVTPGNPVTTATSQGGRHRMFVSENSVSTATTDTMLSPTEIVRPPPNMRHPPPPSWSMYVTRNSKTLPPHQGQNPTVERNTHKSSDEDLEIQGNTLINKSSKATNPVTTDTGFHSNNPPPYPPQSPSVSDAFVDNLGGDSLETSLVQHDSLNRAVATDNANRLPGATEVNQPVRNVPRIPYMQNDMVTEPLIVRPKQSNIQQDSHKSSEGRTFLGKLFKNHRFLPFLHKKSDSSSQNTHKASARDSKNLALENSQSVAPCFQNEAATASVWPRQSAGVSNLETAAAVAANQIGSNSARRQNPPITEGLTFQTQQPEGPSTIATEIRLEGNRPVVCPATNPQQPSSDDHGYYGNSHHSNQPLLGGSEGGVGLRNHTQDTNINVARGDTKSHGLQAIGSDLGQGQMKVNGAIELSPVEGGIVSNSNRVVDAKNSQDISPEGRPKRPSSLVIKSQGEVSNMYGVPRPGGGLMVAGQGSHDSHVTSQYAGNRHVSSPDLSGIVVGGENRGTPPLSVYVAPKTKNINNPAHVVAASD